MKIYDENDDDMPTILSDGEGVRVNVMLIDERPRFSTDAVRHHRDNNPPPINEQAMRNGGSHVYDDFRPVKASLARDDAYERRSAELVDAWKTQDGVPGKKQLRQHVRALHAAAVDLSSAIEGDDPSQTGVEASSYDSKYSGAYTKPGNRYARSDAALKGRALADEAYLNNCRYLEGSWKYSFNATEQTKMPGSMPSHF
jgi:hypothetical protein